MEFCWGIWVSCVTDYPTMQLVEQHGGNVWAESDGVGKGTTFIVELPID